MKRVGLYLLVVMVAVSFMMVGCKGKTTTAPTPPPAQPQPAPPMKQTSKDVNGDLRKAGIAVECGQYKQGIDLATLVLDTPGITKTQKAKAYNYAGLGYLWTKDYNKAIDMFSGAIKEMPNYGAAYYNRAVAYSKAGKKAEAAKDFGMAKKLKYVPGKSDRKFCPPTKKAAKAPAAKAPAKK